MSQKDNAKIYQQKRAKFVLIIKTCFALFVILALFGIVIDTNSFWYFCLCALSVVLAIYVQLTLNTCPKYGTSQFRYIENKGKLIRRELWDLDPSQCQICKERLK